MALGAGSANALSKNYAHCVYSGSTSRGCTSGTWWQVDSTRYLYDRAYWHYVSGPNSTYHVTYFTEEDLGSPSENFRSSNTKSKTDLTARYQHSPVQGGVLASH